MRKILHWLFYWPLYAIATVPLTISILLYIVGLIFEHLSRWIHNEPFEALAELLR